MMRWTHRQLWLAALGLGAVAAVIATGLLGDTGTPDTGPVGTGVTGVLDPPGPDPADDPARADRRTVITLGALDPPPTTGSGGASFDPCTVIGWADLPTAVRPATDARPSPAWPDNGEDFSLGCRFDNSAPTGVFTVTITWATTPPRSLNPASNPGATATTFGDRAGVQRSSTDPQGHRMCTGLLPVTGGAAGATVTNARFPQTDPCTVAAAALTAIATRVP